MANKLKTNLRKHEYLVDKNIQDSDNRVYVDFSKIKREDISKFPTLISDFYNSTMAVSGYGETRHFYEEKSVHMHTGVDVFLNHGEKILAPSGTEIIAAYWVSQDSEWAEGVGGVICLRLKISELNVEPALKEYVYIKKRISQQANAWIHFRVPKLSFSENGIYKQIKNFEWKYESKSEYEDYLNSKTQDEKNRIQKESEYIYLRIIHLSKNTLNLLSSNLKSATCYLPSDKTKYNFIVALDIDIKRPKKVKKGETIGFIGSPSENGGWVTHADINAYSVFSSAFQGPKYMGMWNKYLLSKSLTDQQVLLQINNYMKVKGISKIEDNKKPTRKQNILKLKSDGNFDPNEIFNFYQKDDKKIIAS